MEVETTPWHETRITVPPTIEMLQREGVIQYKNSFLKKESPRTTTPQKRFIHFDANYLKYCFLTHFYQLLFDGMRRSTGDTDVKILLSLLTEVVTDFAKYCREQPSEEDARELFRSFCKAHLFKGDETSL
jgi:hypothetical protein